MSPRRAGAVAGREGDPAAILRAHLLDTAERLLAEDEPGSITTRRLAAAAGVSDGVLYNYFADKNDLLVTALVRRFSRLVAALRAELREREADAAETSLERLALALLELHRAAVPLFGKLLAQPPLLERFFAEIHRSEQPLGGKQIRDAVIEQLDEERRLGRLAVPDSGVAADVLIGSIALLALGGALGAVPEAELDRRTRATVHLLIRGLDPHDTRSST